MDFKVTVDDKPQPDWATAIQTLLGTDEPVRYGQSTINGRTIPADKSVKMFDLRDRELTPAIVKEFYRFDYQACYCSVFDDCWVVSYRGFGSSPEPVDDCPKSEDSFQE